MTDAGNIETKEPEELLPPEDLNETDKWVELNRQNGLITATRHVSFAHQTEEEQWDSIKEQCRLIVRDYRKMGVPDDKITQQILDYVGPEPISKRM